MPIGRAKTRRAQVAREAGISRRQVAVGLEEALWESGPNPLTEFADALQFEGKPMMPPDVQARWEDLGRFREALTAFLSGKNSVAFIGGVAVRSYGGILRMPLRPTGDFDLLVDDALLKELTKFLETQGAVLDSTDEDTYFFYIKALSFHLDVTTARTPFMEECLATAKGAKFQERKLRIVTPTALVAMKVKAFSERRNPAKKEIDRKDVCGLLEAGATTEEAVREFLAKHRPDLLPTLAEILAGK